MAMMMKDGKWITDDDDNLSEWFSKHRRYIIPFVFGFAAASMMARVDSNTAGAVTEISPMAAAINIPAPRRKARTLEARVESYNIEKVSRPINTIGKFSKRDIYEITKEAAERKGVDYRALWAIILAESSGNHLAVSPVGAAGAAQLMPFYEDNLPTYKTQNYFDWKRLREQRIAAELTEDERRRSYLLAAEVNAGRRYQTDLQNLIKRYKNNIEGLFEIDNRFDPRIAIPVFAEGYKRLSQEGYSLRQIATIHNAGMDVFLDYLHGTNNTGRNPDFKRTGGMPPYRETKNFVMRVERHYREILGGNWEGYKPPRTSYPREARRLNQPKEELPGIEWPSWARGISYKNGEMSYY